MITVRTEGTSPTKLAAFPAYVDMLLRNTVDDALDFGENYMTSIVPRNSHRLANAITRNGPISPGASHFIGTVGINSIIAPHAGYVDQGTGVDGPYHAPSIVTRPSRRGQAGKGVHRFIKNGEQVRYRKVVKARPSAKIERSKDFSGRTYRAMRDWMRIRTSVLTTQIAIYFADGRRRR